MRPSFLPRALLFKEWKEHRWWMLAALILMIWQPLFRWLSILFDTAGPASVPGTGGSAAAAGLPNPIFWKVLLPTVYGVQVVPTNGQYPPYHLSGDPYMGVLAGFAAMGLMIALVTVERNRGALWFTLAGPVSRRNLIRTKIMIAVAIVLTASLIRFAVLFGCDLYTHNMLPMSMVFRWFAENLVFDLALMAIGFACATVVMVGMPAGIYAVIISAVPFGIGQAILPTEASTRPGIDSEPPLVLAQHVANFVRTLSPWHYTSGFESMGAGAGPGVMQTALPVGQHTHSLFSLVVWGVVWIFVWGILGYRAYLTAPLENNSHFFIFPWMWVVTLWLVTGIVCWIFVNAEFTPQGLAYLQPYEFLVRLLVLWIPISLVAMGLLSLWARGRRNVA